MILDLVHWLREECACDVPAVEAGVVRDWDFTESGNAGGQVDEQTISSRNSTRRNFGLASVSDQGSSSPTFEDVVLASSNGPAGR